MDGFGALAAVILGAMALMVVVPALLLGVLAHRSWGGGAETSAAVVLGAAIGATAVATTFYSEEITQPSLVVEAPSDFARQWVILLEDPSADLELEWTGMIAPSATLRIPASGVVRVKTLPEDFPGYTEVTLDSGVRRQSTRACPAPPGLHATRVVVFGFALYGAERGPDLLMLRDADLAEQILAFEGP